METTLSKTTTIEAVSGQLVGFGVGRSRSTGRMKWIAVIQDPDGRREIVGTLLEGSYMPFVIEKMRA